MKNKPYDYRGFSLSRLGEPRFRHALLLGGWLAYFALYFLTENLIPAERCYVIHCALDDRIPFNEGFVFFYVGWYFLVFGSLAWTFFFDVERFRKLQIFIMITQAAAMLTYILYPSVQNLRPTSFERSNFLTWLMGQIYAFDTPTGVCPSLHVAYSVGIASVWCRTGCSSRGWKAWMIASAVLISISTTFVKQHSVVDILAALPVCAVCEGLVFGRLGGRPGRRLRAYLETEKV